MPDIVQTLATHTGIDPAMIQKALGTILGMLKAHLPAEIYSQIEEKVPESSQLVDAAPQSSGGLLDAASKLAGKVFGAKAQDGIEMADILKKLGISPDSLVAIITSLFKFLSSHLSPEVMAQVVKALPSIPGLTVTPEGKIEGPASTSSDL